MHVHACTEFLHMHVSQHHHLYISVLTSFWNSHLQVATSCLHRCKEARWVVKYTDTLACGTMNSVHMCKRRCILCGYVDGCNYSYMHIHARSYIHACLHIDADFYSWDWCVQAALAFGSACPYTCMEFWELCTKCISIHLHTFHTPWQV